MFKKFGSRFVVALICGGIALIGQDQPKDMRHFESYISIKISVRGKDVKIDSVVPAPPNHVTGIEPSNDYVEVVDQDGKVIRGELKCVPFVEGFAYSLVGALPWFDQGRQILIYHNSTKIFEKSFENKRKPIVIDFNHDDVKHIKVSASPAKSIHYYYSSDNGATWNVGHENTTVSASKDRYEIAFDGSNNTGSIFAIYAADDLSFARNYFRIGKGQIAKPLLIK